MKVVILAGGYGTRLMEESVLRPKPMVEIGGMPILWHIMKVYSSQGFNEFVICCGYKGYVIKEYFANYSLHRSDVTFDTRDGSMEVHQNTSEPWRVTLVDTGLDSLTGGRIRRVEPYLDGEAFFMTYGDGLADVNLNELLACHKREGKLSTLTAVQPPGRFGGLQLDGDHVREFREKPTGDGGWINGGFFVIESAALKYVEDDQTSWEGDALRQLAAEKQLAAYRHEGFWMPMDTLREKQTLERLWNAGQAPWKVWE
jgi:glucose-1-phosphate cytidylyltransferase